MPSGAGGEVFFAAAAAALTGDILFHPTDTLITRIQSPTYTTRFRTGNGFIYRRLFRGLYQGFGPVLVASIPSSAAFFMVYEDLKNACQRAQSAGYLQHLPQPMLHAFSSGVADAVSCAIMNPAEVLKQNAQVRQSRDPSSAYRGHTMQVLKQFAARPTRLWTGYTMLVASHLPGTSLTFTLYEWLRTLWMKRFDGTDYGRAECISHQVRVSFLSAGLAAGFVSCLFVPIDVVKTRMRLAAGHHVDEDSRVLRRRQTRCKGKVGGDPGNHLRISFVRIARDIFQQEGVAGFFRGITLTCVSAALGGGLYLGCYEGSKLFLREGSQAEEDM